jgi:hypothetical protein
MGVEKDKYSNGTDESRNWIDVCSSTHAQTTDIWKRCKVNFKINGDKTN